MNYIVEVYRLYALGCLFFFSCISVVVVQCTFPYVKRGNL
jgi:hypothetical protein